MATALLSPDSARRRSEGFFGAQVERSDTDNHVSGDVSRPYSPEADETDIANVSPRSEEPPRRYSQEGRDVDIALQHLNGQHSPATSPSIRKKGEYGYVDGYSDTRSLVSTPKKYSHRESRKFIFKTGLARFLMTFFFCFLIAISLKAYEGFKEPRVISKNGVRVFNALMLGLSLGLGLNLASSLKKYAVILRWTLLTRRYVSMEVFDLILGVETLTKVMKLMVISLPGISATPGSAKHRWIQRFPWLREARNDGTKLTWILCLLWLLINIGAQILVAALSLFWPVDPSDSIPLLTYGTVSVSDLATWIERTPETTGNYSSLDAANSYGSGAAWNPSFNVTDTQTDLSSLARNPIYKGDGYYEYRFVNRNPAHMYTDVLVTTRIVQARATCDELQTDEDWVKENNTYYAWGSYDGDNWFKNKLPEWVTGSISWIGSRWEHCGPRCTNLTVYQTHDAYEIKHPSLFLCNSTLSPVTGGEEAFTYLRPEDQEHIFSNDEFARIAAGSIAWTGYTMNKWYDRQTQIYLRGSKWSPNHMVTKEEVEDLIARFTIGAVAAFDDHGVRYEVPGQYTKPVQGQQLLVDWPWVLGLLGGILFMQFSALIALMAFANKSIIRDESFFSLAMLLRPVVNRIGREGMNLSGEEIKYHPELMNKNIRYDYREGKHGEPNKIDIFFQGEDSLEREGRRSWVDGVYS